MVNYSAASQVCYFFGIFPLHVRVLGRNITKVCLPASQRCLRECCIYNHRVKLIFREWVGHASRNYIQAASAGQMATHNNIPKESWISHPNKMSCYFNS